MRTFAIGDIHGCHKALTALVDALELQPEDTVVTLGDYVDRGPDSKSVVDFLIELSEKCELVPLKGNHEQLMEFACDSDIDRMMWLNAGGVATLMSYGESNLADFPDSHWRFYDSLELYHETETHIFVHGGVRAKVPVEEQDEETLLWLRTHELEAHQSGKIIVCGHTPTDDKDILDMGHALCIDTHAFAGGWLTALDVESGIYWQANEDGEVQKHQLNG